jgi:hypothetical protein
MTELSLEIKIGNVEIALSGMKEGVTDIFEKICNGSLNAILERGDFIQMPPLDIIREPATEPSTPADVEKRSRSKKDKMPIACKELHKDEFEYDEDAFSENIDQLSNSTMPMVVYAVYFLENNGFEQITADHIFTMYRRYGKVAGHDFRQGISNAKYAGYVRGEPSDVKVTKVGIEYIEKKISGNKE